MLFNGNGDYGAAFHSVPKGTGPTECDSNYSYFYQVTSQATYTGVETPEGISAKGLENINKMLNDDNIAFIKE